MKDGRKWGRIKVAGESSDHLVLIWIGRSRSFRVQPIAHFVETRSLTAADIQEDVQSRIGGIEPVGARHSSFHSQNVFGSPCVSTRRDLCSAGRECAMPKVNRGKSRAHKERVRRTSAGEPRGLILLPLGHPSVQRGASSSPRVYLLGCGYPCRSFRDGLVRLGSDLADTTASTFGTT